MKEVLKRGLLVVLAIMLCAMPVVAFSGCDNVEKEKITNVKQVIVSSDFNTENSSYPRPAIKYTPVDGVVLINYKSQTLEFYALYTSYPTEVFSLYNVPMDKCVIVYNDTNTTE